ncbi:glycosyltransferase family 39 protein [Shinella sedimenti]|uniref:Glycosyltransferase family 39 protein n=1 Tax=Shinella sedimenti TaxID=2919913 RepID=A0ABT0CIS1_9HYPH|nr:glycosyltransferase family 39 protein [Shinella sedimenti]MCJ8148134.1 glycosyltransferase family 39 protein [Shinella sedimenti]
MFKTFSSRPALFVVVHCFVWWIMILIAKPNLDRYGDMVEVYAWSQHWLAGSSKHPQFLPWMAKIWFLVAPQTVASFYLLSAANLAVAMLGILALGRALRLGDLQVLVALALGALAFPYVTLSDKLNMNAICLSIWPWTAWAFVKATSEQGGKRIVHAALFGVLAGLAMLSKYYSIVLILPLFAFTFLSNQRWLWRTATPWIAIAVYLAVTTPHILWLMAHQDALAYAREQAGDDPIGARIYYIAKFIAAPLFYWPIPFILAGLFLVKGSFLSRCAQLARLPRDNALLGVLALGPWLLTLFFAVVGLVELSTPWAIPIGFAFMLYGIANADQRLVQENGPKIIAGFRFIWPIMLVGSVIAATMDAYSDNVNYYRPEQEQAVAAVEHWNTRHNMPLSWVSSGNLAAMIAFFSPMPIEALPAPPHALPSYYPERGNWRNEAGIIACPVQAVGSDASDCIEDAKIWASLHGLQSEAATFTIARSGIRFPRKLPFQMSVVYVWPR